MLRICAWAEQKNNQYAARVTAVYLNCRCCGLLTNSHRKVLCLSLYASLVGNVRGIVVALHDSP